jgi:hypothetical protein
MRLKELTMIERVPGDDDIETAVRNWDALWVVENDVHALGGR